jgi:uncharacterized protein (DUF1501 family)
MPMQRARPFALFCGKSHDKATTDLRAVLKDHLRLDDAVLAADIFPDSAAVRPMSGLVG